MAILLDTSSSKATRQAFVKRAAFWSRGSASTRLRPMKRTVWLLLGYAAVGLAIAGAALPLLPTTPFLLVAAYAFARSSPRLHKWLMEHKQFGPLIDNWNRYGAISPRAKATAIAVMLATLAGSWLWDVSTTVLALQAAIMAGAATFILSRPNGPGGE